MEDKSWIKENPYFGFSPFSMAGILKMATTKPFIAKSSL